MKRSEQFEMLTEQNKALIDKIEAQQKQIDELVRMNIQILHNTDKMGKHIDFINKAYDKITKSYLFKNILG
jgi:hypothetical protein